MANSTKSLQEKMNVLRRVYALELPTKVAELERWFVLFQQNKGETESLKTLQRLSHSLVGSGATFGFPSVSERAAQLNSLLKAVLSDPSQVAETKIRKISDSLDGLKEVSLQNIPVTSTPWFDQAALEPPPWLSHEATRRIFLVEKDSALGNDLALQISYFGYRVELFGSTSEIRETMNRRAPDAIIADVDSVKMELLKGFPLPIVFFSARDDLEARLVAVRAGGAAYFAKPVDAAALADKLDSLISPQDTEPFRVLIVEDEILEAKRYAAILDSAGITSFLVTDPMKVMRSLIEFKPDLILTDIFMPRCNGMELATVIRQQEAYVGIPIVFCSIETDLSKQFEALLRGGDDFLTKPVQPERLVSLVTSRARRGRVLRSHIVHDGLTGLLNHTNIKLRLALEMARSRRHKEQLGYAMIDIDRLKFVNDTYGHMAGDRVIKTVARLFRQRLRKTDIIGRYGGDEFVAILIGADASSAAKILNEIRDSFSQIRYQTQETGFSVTMSCGLASFPEYDSPDLLHAVSDKALLKAKAGGGNRIVLAGEA